MQCTISGSFRKFYREICQTYEIFEQNGITVLSPRNSKIINPGDEFVLLETDSIELTKKQLEDKHLDAIANSDFLYLVNPQGYTGDSCKFEIGYAHGKNKPIYSSNLVSEGILREYISKVLPPNEMIYFLKMDR